MGPFVCNMLWIGPRMGQVERACARSVLRQGHALRIWSYHPVDGLPEGAEAADAAEVLPREAILRHVDGSVSLFSNWFRYELQRRGLGTWLDCDMYLIRPLETEQPHLLVEEEPGALNGAVLRLPRDSPILPPLLRLFGQRTVPFWLPPRERLAAWKRLILTRRTELGLMRWGVAGPAALTALSHRHGIASLAYPAEVYHPVHWRDALWIVDPSLDLDAMITSKTRAVHLWNECIKGVKDGPAPGGSFLFRLYREGD